MAIKLEHSILVLQFSLTRFTSKDPTCLCLFISCHYLVHPIAMATEHIWNGSY